MIFSSINIESILLDVDTEYTNNCNDSSCNHKYVRNIASMDKATNEELMYSSSDNVKQAISSIAQAQVILYNNSLIGIVHKRKKSAKIPQCMIFLENHRLAIMKVMKRISIDNVMDDQKCYGRNTTCTTIRDLEKCKMNNTATISIET
jgi:hypothetical protein